MACYIPRRYTRPKTVTHPGTNRARRALTSFMRRTPLTTTPRRQRVAVVTVATPVVRSRRSALVVRTSSIGRPHTTPPPHKTSIVAHRRLRTHARPGRRDGTTHGKCAIYAGGRGRGGADNASLLAPHRAVHQLAEPQTHSRLAAFTLSVSGTFGRPDLTTICRFVSQCRLYLHWGPGHSAAKRGPSLENIYRVSITTDLCEAKYTVH